MQKREPLEQLNEFGKLTANIVKRINDYTMETTNDFLTTGAKNFKDLASVKKMEDSLDVQRQIMTETGTKLVSNSKKAWEVSMQNFSEVSEWLESNVGFMKSMNPINPMNFSQNKPASEKKN